MKLKITKLIETTEEVDVTLKKSSNSICLMVGLYHVLAIKSDGKIVLYQSCEKTGLNVDDDGYIIVEK